MLTCSPVVRAEAHLFEMARRLSRPCSRRCTFPFPSRARLIENVDAIVTSCPGLPAKDDLAFRDATELLIEPW